jgi:hypothetical protein
MIIDTSDWTRIFLVYGIQLTLGIFFFYFGIVIIKRNQNHIGRSLGCFYLTIASIAFLNAILIPIRTNPAAFLLYFIILYLGFFAHSFLVIFTRNIGQPHPNGFKILIGYLIITFIILLYPEGFRYNRNTNWRPQFAFSFSILLILYYTIFLIIPILYYSEKLYKSFNDALLKQQLKYFLIGVLCLSFMFYGMLFYVFWDNHIYRIIWSVIAIFSIPSGFLIYYGIGRKI